MDNKNQEKQLGSLEEESLKRKERLKNLKQKVEDDKNPETKPKFRSYTPQDKTISDNETNSQKQLETGIAAIEDEIKDQLELLKTPIMIEEIDITNLAPRKQDWDLKRDVSKKLEKLEWQTQKAIAELIRERLKNTQEDIFQVVNLGTEFKTKLQD